MIFKNITRASPLELERVRRKAFLTLLLCSLPEGREPSRPHLPRYVLALLAAPLNTYLSSLSDKEEKNTNKKKFTQVRSARRPTRHRRS